LLLSWSSSDRRMMGSSSMTTTFSMAMGCLALRSSRRRLSADRISRSGDNRTTIKARLGIAILFDDFQNGVGFFTKFVETKVDRNLNLCLPSCTTPRSESRLHVAATLLSRTQMAGRPLGRVLPVLAGRIGVCESSWPTQIIRGPRN
jgi:hypothetical protein